MGKRTKLIVGISIPGILLSASLFALPVLAQGAGGSGLSAPANPTVPPSLSPGPGLTGQAPVGHFQPRRDAAPQENNNPYQESAEDKALDRKIKSICRGC